MSLKLFQGVLVNNKIAGRDNYVSKIYTNPPVVALYFENWWEARLGLQGQKEGMQSQLVKSGLSLGLFLPSMTEAIGCNLAMFIVSYNCFKKNEDTKVMPFKMHHVLNHSLRSFPQY